MSRSPLFLCVSCKKNKFISYKMMMEDINATLSASADTASREEILLHLMRVRMAELMRDHLSTAEWWLSNYIITTNSAQDPEKSLRDLFAIFVPGGISPGDFMLSYDLPEDDHQWSDEEERGWWAYNFAVVLEKLDATLGKAR